MRVILNDYITTLTNAFNKAETGYICTPFYTKNGLDIFKGFSTSGDRVEFWTRLNILDWVNGFADLPALLALLNAFNQRSKETIVYMNDSLHAKVYIADNKLAYLGSANLTYGGLRDNIEVLIELTDEETSGILEWVSYRRGSLIRLDLSVLSDYIDISAGAVNNFPKTEVNLNDEESKDLNAAIELAEDILIAAIAKEKGKTTEDIKIDKLIGDLPELDDFIAFCGKLKRKDKDALEVVDRHNGKNNLQGHIKQSYYNAILFLTIYPDVKTDILKWKDNEVIKMVNKPWIRRFREFMDENKDYINDEYRFSFRVLKNILPDSIGGNTVGGGGGISSFRRVLRLTALMLNG